MVGIYRILNKINGKVYIGQSIDIFRRLTEHRNHLVNNIHENKHLQSAWNKYGEKNFKFEIAEECLYEYLTEREQYWIDYYGGMNSKNNYNKRDASSKGELSEESKNKISQAHLGKHLSEETKRKISIAGKGKKFTQEQIAKISKSNKITCNSEKEVTRRKLSAKKQWENLEYRELMTNLWKGKHHTEETKQKMKENHADVSSKNNPMYGKGKKVCMIDPNINEIIKIFPSVLQAANETNNCHNNIRNYCSKDKTLNGYKWRYINE